MVEDNTTDTSPAADRRIPVVIAVDGMATAEWVRATLREHPLVDIVGQAQDGLEAAQMARALRPVACIVETDLPIMDGYRTCELVSLAAPGVATVLVQSQPWSGATQAAMRVGARAILTSELEGDELLEVLTELSAITERRMSREYQQVTDPSLMPMVIAVSAAKGGVGKTTVAVNLAVTLAQRFPGEVVLVDYYSQYGDAAVMLGLTARRTINDLASEGEELDETRIPAYLLTHPSGLLLLPGAAEPSTATDHLAVDFTCRLVTALRRQFRFVIMDLPPMLTASALHVVSRCQYFLVVCNFLELTGLRDTTILINSVMGQYISGERLKLVGNRVMPGNRYVANDLEKAVGHPVVHQIPDGADVPITAINSGVPFVIGSPNTPIAASIRGLADMLDPRRDPRPVVIEEEAPRGLLARLTAAKTKSPRPQRQGSR